jgi:15-cis-phytoene synthase
MSIEKQIFKQGSTTYYFSSRFFPRRIRKDVFRLYSFVRVADDYVDQPIPEKQEFLKLKKLWDKFKQDDSFNTRQHKADTINERVIKNIIHLCRHYNFDLAWVEAFFDSMQADLDKKQYKTLDDTLWYVYGSAEVIGLMMARIMRLPQPAYEYAKMQGRAMQYINFLRDAEEDSDLGRCYFPREDLKTFGLHDLSRVHVTVNPQNFKDFMAFQLQRYDAWQAKAEKGFKYIPRRIRIPLKTAVDMYDWTAAEIAADPFAVYHRKVKPKRHHVVRRGLRHMVTPHRLP